jgi:hypothetical protein
LHWGLDYRSVKAHCRCRVDTSHPREASHIPMIVGPPPAGRPHPNHSSGAHQRVNRQSLVLLIFH